MEGADQKAGTVAPQSGPVVITAWGWIVVIGLFCGLLGAAFFGISVWRGSNATVPSRPLVATASQSNAELEVQRLSRELEVRAAEHKIQLNAWRAAAETNKRQISLVTDSLSALDKRVDVIQKAVAAMPTPAQPQVRAARESIAGVASASQAAHKALDRARASAEIDLSSLPVQTITASALGVTGFSNGSVQINGQSISAGQALQKGEIIVAIDSDSHSIVTSQRIISVTN